MRTGLGRNAGIPFTGWSPTLGVNTTGNVTDHSNNTSGVVGFNGITQNDDRISKQMRVSGPTMKAFRQIMSQLLNAGTTVGNATYKQIPGSRATATSLFQNNLGGLIVPPATAILSNRAVSAADKSAFVTLVARSNRPTSYVKDLSGNAVERQTATAVFR